VTLPTAVVRMRSRWSADIDVLVPILARGPAAGVHGPPALRLDDVDIVDDDEGFRGKGVVAVVMAFGPACLGMLSDLRRLDPPTVGAVAIFGRSALTVAALVGNGGGGGDDAAAAAAMFGMGFSCNGRRRPSAT